MKIAVLGSAPSSVRLAPFKDSNYQGWIQGKVEELARAHGQIGGDFQIWGCSPGAWAVATRATRWFEVHRWEPGQNWFSVEYVEFLRKFAGPVYTGAAVGELPNHVIYPIDRIEEKFSSYFLTSSLALMLALAIDEIEEIRAARCGKGSVPPFVPEGELTARDEDDLIGMWGVDMAADQEWGYQRPGCQFFILEAMRRGIKIYLPPESDIMRPMPVYGISEWDHNYIKLTARAREINAKIAHFAAQRQEADTQIPALQGELAALNSFVNTWTSPYGMRHGLTIEQVKGTGLGSGITHVDQRPVTRMTLGESPPSREKVVRAIGEARARPSDEQPGAVMPPPVKFPTE